MSDPHPPHSQPLRPLYVDGTRVEYFAEYSDGRRCSVSKIDALRFEEAWRKEGVRVITRVHCEQLRVIGEFEGPIMNDTVPEPFTWREIEFKWHSQRQAMAGTFLIGDQRHWVLVKDNGRFQAWIEWGNNYTLPCTMLERTDALEGARLWLLDSAREYHEKLVARFG